MNAENATTETDVLVIGAGPAGYAAAIRAGQLDLDVTLVEKGPYGGTCLNHGCIPSKALLSATDVAHEARHAEAFGVYADPKIDLAEMVSWKDDVVDRMSGSVEKLCKASGVTLLTGHARFVDEHTVRVESGEEDVDDGSDQDAESPDAEIVAFERAIVATGSRPIEIPNFSYADDPVLSSRQALALESVPDSLVIVGAGYIGMELAGVFAKLGTTVTVVEMLDDILPGYESDLARPVKKRAKSLGIEFEFGYTAADWHERDDGDGIRVVAEPAETSADADATDDADEPDTNAAAEEPLELDADAVLVAVGREPVSDTLDLEQAGVETDDRGFVSTDQRARTNNQHIFAVGDVAGEPMLAHKGSAEGKVAAEVIAGESSTIDGRAIPAAVFTDPEIGTVGLTAEEAEADGFEVVTGEFPFRASGRALTTGETDGFVRIVADADSGRVLGGQVVGPEASELLAELSLAVELEATLADVSRTIHAHPTLAEAVMEAAENALGHAIHTLNR